MLFYILITAALLALFFMISRIGKMKRHDDVLYGFCDLRRQAIQQLRDEDNFNSLSRQEYIALRKMLLMLNVIISEYKSHRTIMFNLRYFVKYLAEFKRQKKKTQAIETTKNESIEALRKDIQRALLFAFVQYTPFIRSEVVLKVSIFMLGMLARTGMKRVNRYVESLREAFALTHGHNGLAAT